MTTPNSARPTGSTASGAGPSRSMQEDLLHELRAAAPMPAPPATAAPRLQPEPAPRPEEKPGTTLELRLAPQRWCALRIGGARDGSGLRAAIGPVRLALRKPAR